MSIDELRKRLTNVVSQSADETQSTAAELLDVVQEELSEVHLEADQQWVCEFYCTDLRTVTDWGEEEDPVEHRFIDPLPDDLWVVSIGAWMRPDGGEPEGVALVLLLEAGNGDWTSEQILEEEISFAELSEILTGGDYESWEAAADLPIVEIRLMTIGG